jgi:hypothetical protein
MKTTSKSLAKIAFGVGFSCLGFFGSQLLLPQPAQAITWPEVGKIFGIWNRYIEDIQKTMYAQPQPNPQPTPSIDSQAPTAPPSNDLNPEFESIITN